MSEAVEMSPKCWRFEHFWSKIASSVFWYERIQSFFIRHQSSFGEAVTNENPASFGF